jgi:hypothetical protein
MSEQPSSEENRRNGVRKNFETELRKNGFGFQYALLKEVNRLYNAENSAWFPEFAEFPVEISNTNTHIDFILARKERSRFPKKHPFFLICECKRANPALSNWCFVRSPFAREGLLLDFIFIEKLQLEHQWSTKKSYVQQSATMGKKVFDIAFNVKSENKGEGDSKGVNDAVSQVLRGMNGFIKYCGEKENLLRIEHKGTYAPYFLPVIFTTAQLWTSLIDLSESNLTDGNLDFSVEGLVSEPWLLFQYNQSQPIKHSIDIHYSSNEIFNVAQTEFTRTVAIVNPEGIEDFLYRMSLQYLD